MQSTVATRPYSDPTCKKVLALLTILPEWEIDLCKALEAVFGSIDYKGSFNLFDGTEYYQSEMGGPLYRAMASFSEIENPQGLVEWKWKTHALEKLWSQDGKRTRNLDIGYMDPDKMVLASFKRGPWKLYLEQGVWADMTMHYTRGEFEPTPWTFADFKTGRYNQSLKTIREKMKNQMR